MLAMNAGFDAPANGSSGSPDPHYLAVIARIEAMSSSVEDIDASLNSLHLEVREYKASVETYLKSGEHLFELIKQDMESDREDRASSRHQANMVFMVLSLLIAIMVVGVTGVGVRLDGIADLSPPNEHSAD